MVVCKDTYTGVHMYKAFIYTFTEVLAHTHTHIHDRHTPVSLQLPGPPLILGPGTRAQSGHQTLLGRT